MNEKLKDIFFIGIRLIIMLVLCISGLLSDFDKSGVSLGILLLVSFYIGAMSVKEIVSSFKIKITLSAVGTVLFCLIAFYGKSSFFLLGFFTVYEIMTLFTRINYKWYFLPIAGVFFDTSADFFSNIITVFIMAALYIQNNFIVIDFQKRKQEDDRIEQQLKKEMVTKEYNAQNEIKQGMLAAENKVLEDRAALSQTLHDKLGHNINGSIYQLEGAKLLMEKDPEKSRTMIQAVIDQLRTGMDEIRGILRRERPEKMELALLQLYKLCEDCNKKGVETEFTAEGDTSRIGDELWEVVLDNAFEVVTNAMKYAKCKHININLVVMNQMLRCSITDDGIGCGTINEGMGISGMRRRVRAAGGTISFETEAGFSVTMLLPMEK